MEKQNNTADECCIECCQLLSNRFANQYFQGNVVKTGVNGTNRCFFKGSWYVTVNVT